MSDTAFDQPTTAPIDPVPAPADAPAPAPVTVDPVDPLAAVQAQIAGLTAANLELQARLANGVTGMVPEAYLKATEEDLAKAKARIADLEAMVDHPAVVVTPEQAAADPATQAALDTAATALQNALEKQKTDEATIIGMQQQLADAQAAYQKGLAQAQAENDAAIAAQQKLLDDTHAQIDDLQAQLATAQEAAEKVVVQADPAVVAENAELKARIANAETAIVELTTKLSNAKDDLAVANTTIAVLKAEDASQPGSNEPPTVHLVAPEVELIALNGVIDVRLSVDGGAVSYRVLQVPAAEGYHKTSSNTVAEVLNGKGVQPVIDLTDAVAKAA